MKRIIPIIIILFLIVAAVTFRAQLAAFGADAYAAITSRAPEIGAWLNTIRNPQSAIPTALTASGAIEAPTISVGSTLGGRIVKLAVGEGQAIAAGDLIAELDTTLLDAEIVQAEAARNVARAQVVLQEAGAREADLDVARAAVKQAESGRDAAYTAWQDAQALIDAPSDLDVKIASADAGLRAAEEQAAAADAGATAADLEMQLWARTVKSLEEGFNVDLPPIAGGGTIHVEAPSEKLADARLQWNLASQRTWEAHARAAAAAAARNSARQTLADLRRVKADPLALDAQAAAAKSAYEVAGAAVVTAQANLAVLQAGAPAEQIAAARTQVDRAESTIHTLQTRKKQASLYAPENGVVSTVVLHAGEVAAPGAAIVRLYQPEEATLTIYVPTPEMGQVRVGTEMGVTVDSFPGRVFTGTVTYIAGEAEFTPKNVQTREERAGTVFPVKIKLANPQGLLKPGMPADAWSAGLGIAPLSRSPTPPLSAFPLSASRFSGSIEADETAIAAELGGRAIVVGIAEGDAVRSGQVAVELDDSEWQSRRGEAEAALAAARAELVRVAAAPQLARVAQGEAQVKQANAALAAAETALANARTLRENPQELDAQINSAGMQAAAAASQIDVARAQVKSARVLQESVQGDVGTDQERTRRAMYDQGVAAAEARQRAAEASGQGAQAALAKLQAIRKNPIALDAAIHRAEGQASQAQAAVKVAEASLAQVRAPAQAEAVAVAQAKVAQAEAALAGIDATLAKLVVRSPAKGIVTSQAIRAGEICQAGVPLFTVIDLESAKLIIYVPTSQIGEVKLGQAAEVSVDAYGGRIFAGRVTRIADRAEFTPKNVQTQEERAKTVFAVEIVLDNTEGLLRPGMPGDARLAP